MHEREERELGSAWFSVKTLYRVTIRNAYGQRLRWKYLEVADAFKLPQSPGDQKEVYSQTFLIDRSTKDRSLIEAHFGPAKSDRPRRKNFVV